jgi:hypothetical protein
MAVGFSVTPDALDDDNVVPDALDCDSDVPLDAVDGTRGQLPDALDGTQSSPNAVGLDVTPGWT